MGCKAGGAWRQPQGGASVAARGTARRGHSGRVVHKRGTGVSCAQAAYRGGSQGRPAPRLRVAAAAGAAGCKPRMGTREGRVGCVCACCWRLKHGGRLVGAGPAGPCQAPRLAAPAKQALAAFAGSDSKGGGPLHFLEPLEAFIQRTPLQQGTRGEGAGARWVAG